MKLRLSKIPGSTGLPVKGPISLEALNQRMSEAPDNEIIFLTEPQLDLVITKQIQGAEISGSVATSYRQPCGRCGEDLELPLTVTVQLELKRASREGEDLLEDDVGIIIFDGEHIELEEIIQEHLILCLSPILLPECKRNGDCLLCGKKQAVLPAEEKNTVLLGDLFKMKGIKTSK